MKRFYHPTAIAALALGITAMSLGVSATAEEWRAIRPGAESERVVHRPVKTAAERWLHQNGIFSSSAKLQPSGVGLQQVPDLSKRASRPITRTMEEPRANLYAIVARSALITSEADCYLAQINGKTLTAKQVFKGPQFFQSYGNDAVGFQGTAYHDGRIYIPQQTGLTDGGYVWNVVNVETGRVEETHYFGYNELADPYSMIWHPEKQCFYGLSFSSDSHSRLVKVDPKDWSVTHLGRLGSNSSFMAGLVYNPVEKVVYSVDGDNNMWQVDIADGYKDGRASGRSPLDIDFNLFSLDVGGAMITYSPMDQCYIAFYLDSTQQGNIYFTIDPDTLEVMEVGKIKNADCLFTSIFCTDDLAEAEAPELPVASVFNFEKASLSGTITVKVPEFTFYGLAIPADTPVRTVITCDGTQIAEASLKAGDNHTFNVTVPSEGVHNFETICYIGNYKSPARKQKVAIGNDVPMAPTDIVVAGKTIRWTAPGGVGANEGYVDTDALTYDVYIDDRKLNDAPLKVTSYTVTEDIAQTRHKIQVSATANGHTSERAFIERVFGGALKLPFSVRPNKEESNLFTVENPSDDAFFWKYTYEKDDPSQSGMIYPMSLYQDADDWLILPLMHFDSTEKLYQYSFQVNSTNGKETKESFDIYMGKSMDIKELKKPENCLYNNDCYVLEANPSTVAVNFAVPAAGDYYVAIHCRSTKKLMGKGMYTFNHTVKALDGQSSAVPGRLETVSVIPAPKAELALDITAELPTLDLIGNPLPMDKELTLIATCADNTASVKGLPGTEVNVRCKVPELGFNVVDLTVANENGEGIHSTYRRYVGVDRPFPPENIRSVTSDDNMSMTLTWEAPGEVGVNGGYVDPASLTYDIYLRTSPQQYSTVATGINALTYTFTTGAETMQRYVIGPVSRSAGGISSNALFQADALGKPYEIPMQEEFNTAKFNYSHTLYSFNTHDQYAGSMWENHNQCAYYEGLANCNENQGALMAYSETGQKTTAFMNLPKATTLNTKSGLKFKLRVWDYSSTPNFALWGRHSGDQEYKIIKEFTPERPLLTRDAKWNDCEVDLPAEYHDNPWVQFAISADLKGGDTEWFVLDSYEIGPDVNCDVKVNPIQANSHVKVGTSLSAIVPIFNVGLENCRGRLYIDLLQPDGSIVERRSVNFTIASHAIQERKVSFEVNGDFARFETLKVRATVETDEEDQNLSNNVREVTVNVEPSILPAVSNLKGSATDEGASLSWRRAQGAYGNVQDFEISTPFLNTEDIDGWKNIDLDGEAPAVIGSGNLALTFPDYEKPSAWTVIDPSKTVFKDDERLQAHTGRQYLLARSLFIAGTGAEQKQASDWLISPELAVPTDGNGDVQGTKISFWYNTISPSDKEYVYLWVSYTGTNLDPVNATSTRNGDFYCVRPFSKVGPEGWEYVEYDLPAGTKHVALVYSSYAASGAMLDDIKITPKDMNVWEVDHYSVWRTSEFGTELIEENVTDLSYIDKEYGMFDDGAKYFITVWVKLPNGGVLEGPKSNIADLSIDNSGVDAVETLTGIYGSTGQIHFAGFEEKTLDVYTADGKLVAVVRPTNALYAVDMPAGIYVVTESGKSAKVLVK